jgi:acyl phosphate:glycerol-3-phosphate acyltransferase
VPQFLCLLLAYLLGSIPTAYIIARWRRGIDIREVGLRNMGATNTIREVNWPWGMLVAVVDIGKGAAAVYVAHAFGLGLPWQLAAGFTAFLGHNYPVYLKFRGGKGTATMIGVCFALAPVASGMACGVIALVLLITRHVFTSVAISAPFFILFFWLVERDWQMVVFVIAAVLFLFFRNRGRLGEMGRLKQVRRDF